MVDECTQRQYHIVLTFLLSARCVQLYQFCWNWPVSKRYHASAGVAFKFSNKGEYVIPTLPHLKSSFATLEPYETF